ncbi:MAG TPA: TOBE-like domain-containing protein, partial [Gammaproteobacteria bacterium]|nr:TOBE-like domain-containing protein [Gammaproteobacteria bacterium]
THDQEEALEVADRIVVMKDGRIEQAGTPDEVYHHPVSEFVMSFVGTVNRVEHRNWHDTVETNPGLPGSGVGTTTSNLIYVRPADLSVSLLPSPAPGVRAVVKRINTAGPVVRLSLVAEDGQSLVAEMDHHRISELELHSGHTVQVSARRSRSFERLPSEPAPQ